MSFGNVADVAGRRCGLDPSSTLPLVAGHVSLALALTAYDQWLHDPQADIVVAVEQAMASLKDYMQGS